MSRTPTRARRIGMRVLAGFFALLLLISVRVWVSSAAELRRASVAAGRSEIHETITHLRRAARWYAPLSPYPREALTRLIAIAERAEQAEDPQTALRAYRAVRGSTQAARSLYLPHADLANKADRGIARLTARVDVPEADIAEVPDAEDREAMALTALADYAPPAIGWVLAALFGFVLFLVGVFGIALRAVDADDRFIPPALRKWGGLAALGGTVCALALAMC